MKTKRIINKILFTLFLAITMIGCEGYENEVIEGLDVDREFSPIELSSLIRNQTIVELDWVTKESVEFYVVEFSADDPDFTTIFKSVDVTAEELPIQIALEGETVYSIRVKAVSAVGLDDSKWSTTQATTLSEQIVIASEDGDIAATSAIIRWTPGSNVTHIIATPGDINHTITEAEKAAGFATITGLEGEVTYDITLYNNDKKRGFASFTTGIEIGNNAFITPADDLFQTIVDAEDGAIILLDEGDYTSQTGTINLNKSITIRGYKPDFKPLLKVGFSIEDGAVDVSLIDLDFIGDLDSELIDLVSYSAVGNFNSMLIKGCNIHDFNRSFVRGSTPGSILQTLNIENTIVTNVLTSGGDFIDFRSSDVLNINITNSTFNNCAPGRDFFRLDDSGNSTNTGLVCKVLLENCTLNAISNSASRRLLYIRFNSNDITVRNNIITNTLCEGYSDQSKTDETVTLEGNNYFNADGFTTANTVFDDTDTFTTLDPGYADAAAGNFTISNQDLIDSQVGDPRWR